MFGRPQLHQSHECQRGHLHPARCTVHNTSKIPYIPFKHGWKEGGTFPFPKHREPCLMTSTKILFRFSRTAHVFFVQGVIMLCRALISPLRWSFSQLEKLGARQVPSVGLKGQKPLSLGQPAPPLFVVTFGFTLWHVFLTCTFIFLWEVGGCLVDIPSSDS